VLKSVELFWSGAPVFFISTFSLQGLTCFVLLISLIQVTMVLITEERKWKNRAHIGWISGMISLFVLTVLSAGYAFALLLFTDTCAVKNTYSGLKTTSGLNRLYPELL
jgi:hypothetical protein